MSSLINQDNEKITQYLNSKAMQGYLNSVIGSNKDKFATSLISTVNQNKALQECTNISLVSGALVAATLNLNLNSAFGYAYLVPFNNKKAGTKEAQFQLGYKGYIQLALRTGQYKRINAVPVYCSQFKSWNALTEDLELSSFDIQDNDEVVGYVAYFKLNNGFEKTMFWSYEKMLKHADTYSQAFNASDLKKLQNNQIPQNELWKYSSFWYKSFDDMALKTMIRQVLSKFGIMSEEMIQAYEADQTVINEKGSAYPDNPNILPTEPEKPNLNIAPEKDPLVSLKAKLRLGSLKVSEFDAFLERYGITIDNAAIMLEDTGALNAMIEEFRSSDDFQI